MEPNVQSCTRTPPRGILYFCFFISGIAGLSYEVIWSKYLALYVGSTGLAQVIVLATFMGGLAIGSQLFGALADRVANPLRLYMVLEFGIGVYALLFDKIFVIGRALFVALAKTDEPHLSALLAGKILSCALSVLLPTILMGGTMPAMARYLVRGDKTVGSLISRLYFLNSIGAVVGCLVAGFYTIRTLGLQFTMVTGAFMNIVAGLIAFVLVSRDKDRQLDAMAPEQDGPAEPRPAWVFPVLLACASISGAISMLYEVSWIRLLALVLGSSTYAFSLMLATFILGLSLGGLLLSMKKSPGRYTLIFGASSVGVGFSVLLTLPFYERLPFAFNHISAALNREPATFPLYELCQFVLCAMVMIVPTILQGVTLPAATRALMSDVSKTGRIVGLVFAVNTLGTLAGSIFAGFFGLPSLGVKGTLELAVALNSLVGLIALAAAKPGRMRSMSLAAAALALVLVWAWYGGAMRDWDERSLANGLYRARHRVASFAAMQKEAPTRRCLFYRDGVDATVAVHESLVGGERSLSVNGKVDASLKADLPTQKMLGHLPLLVHPAPKRVLIIGIGSGATVGAALAHDVERIDVVEISRDVAEASRHFESINARYWDDPRVHVYIEDAKTFCQVTDRSYDVIISEPSNPWVAGVAGVFSREYFEICRDHLAPGGLFLQWTHTYELEDAAFFMILETFTGVFPCYTMWNAQANDVLLIGSATPYAPDFARMEKTVAETSVGQDLQRIGIKTLLPVLALQMRNSATRPSHISWTGAIHSDFFPVLEYIAPRGFFIGASANGVKQLDGRARSPAGSTLWIADYLKQHEPTREELGDLYAYLRDRGSIFARSPLAWAAEWRARFPDDVQATAAYSMQLGATYDEALRYAPQDESLDVAVHKLRCGRLLANYTQKRNVLRDAGARPTLEAILWVIGKYPDKIDGDLLYWRSQLEYDLGLYADAATSARAAINLLKSDASSSRSRQVECGILLCRALMDSGNRAAAAGAYLETLEPFEGEDIGITLIRSQIRDSGT